MARIARIMIAALAIGGAAPVLAEPPPPPVVLPPPPPAATAPAAKPVEKADPAHARKADLARRYFVAMHFGDVMDQMMRSLLPTMVDAELRRYPHLPDRYRSAMAEAVIGGMHDVMPRVIDSAVDVVADTFTEEELQKMVEFYESPVGQSVVKKSMSLSPGMADAFRRVEPLLQERMMKRLCSAVDCHDLPAPVTPS